MPDLTVAGAAARAAASAAAVCISYVRIGGALRAPLYVHDKIHTAAAEAAAEAAAPDLATSRAWHIDTPRNTPPYETLRVPYETLRVPYDYSGS